MNLNPRDLTQGGQVAFMRLKMFLQINNLISYYVIMGIVLLGIAMLLIRISLQNLMNGIIYWFVRACEPLTKIMVSQPVYTIRYYEHKLTDTGAIRFRQGEQEKIVDPQSVTEDRHIDLAYALTVHGVQGASERFVIALAGVEGGRQRMASIESLYVTLSRAKEHVQVYTDDVET